MQQRAIKSVFILWHTLKEGLSIALNSLSSVGLYPEIFWRHRSLKGSLALFLTTTMVGCGEENFESLKPHRNKKNKILNLATILIYEQKNLAWVKTGRDDSRFTISKYLINVMEIKLLSIKIFMFISNFPRLTVLSFYKGKPFQTFVQFRGLLKEINGEKWLFCFEKEGRNKKNVKGCKTLSSSNRETKNVIKKRNFNF